MKQKTISQELFEKFCFENFLRLKSVGRSRKQSRKTPDYILTLQRHKVIVEVKQLDPNPEDRSRLKSLRKHGTTGEIINEPGHRIRRKISRAMPQLKQRSIWRKPSILVLYDHTGLLIGELEPYDIKNAMYGEEKVDFFVDEATTEPQIYWRHRFGGKRKVSPNYNTALSAIAILFEDNEGLKFDIFHHEFQCQTCDQKFILSIETYHGAGGLWDSLD